MKNAFRKYWFPTTVAVFLFASVSFAQQTTQIQINGVGNGANLFNVYLDPYNALLGTGSSTVSTLAICDDWYDNTSLNQSWTANVFSLPSVGSIPSGSATPLYGANQTLYNELAWLGAQLLANPTNTTNQEVISFTMWTLGAENYPYGTSGKDVFPSNSSLTSITVTWNGSTTTLLGAINQELAAAQAAAAGFNGAGWEVLTPTGFNCAPGAVCNEPQEFLVYTPEASTMLMLGVGVLGLLAMAFCFRRNALQPAA